MFTNNPMAPRGVNPKVEMYGKDDGYTYLAEKHSEVVLNAANLSQDLNIIPMFDKSETEVTILGSNIDEPKKLPAGTDFLGMQSSVRFMLKKKSGESGAIPTAVVSAAQVLAWRAVMNFAPDQRNSFGQFKQAKHFPVLTVCGETATDTGAIIASSGNDAASTNIVEIPIPWQSRATLNAKIYLPKWEDATTELIACCVITGRVTEGPAQ